MLAIHEPVETISATTRSQASLAYETVRGDILSGRHEPGKKLKIHELALELRVSAGAVREALSRLVPEQLVVSWDQRGFSVAPLSVAELEDLTDVRCEIEVVALRRSVARGDIEWETGLIAAAHRLRATPLPEPGSPAASAAPWIVAHAEFHRALVSGCGSKRLKALHAQLYEQAERYRGLSGRVESKREIVQEHQEIVDLAIARDAERLVEAVTAHLRETTSLIVNAARKSANQVI